MTTTNYQYKFYEISCGLLHNESEDFPREDYELKELRLECLDLLLEIVPPKLSERNKKLFSMWLEGKTQQEMAKELGVVRSVVIYHLRTGTDNLFQQIKSILETSPIWQAQMERIRIRQNDIYNEEF